MALDGTTIAAIITGILALIGAIAAASMSGWNEGRKEARANKKVLVRYSVSLTIAAWELTNWFYDILDDEKYSPEQCKAYGYGWSREFTSYLIGQYFAGVYILREMIHFFPHIRGKEAEMLKKLLWKIQDEFTSLALDAREDWEMRWFEGDVLAAQERLTEVVKDDGAGTARQLRPVSWTEFRKNYASKNSGNPESPEWFRLFSRSGTHMDRIIYRRFKSLYTERWLPDDNPQKLWKEEEELIQEEQNICPGITVVIPDHRVRRLQHLLSDLVKVLDSFTAMKLNRPVKRCEMSVKHRVDPKNNPLGLVNKKRIPCDCNDIDCNPSQEDFPHRKLPAETASWRSGWRKPSSPSQGTQQEQEHAPPGRKVSMERSKV
jgi:hypothetical protein